MTCPQCEANEELVNELKNKIAELRETIADQAETLETCTESMKEALSTITVQSAEIQYLRAGITEYKNTLTTAALIRSRANGH
jgi:chromosome segregation ATPase